MAKSKRLILLHPISRAKMAADNVIAAYRPAAPTVDANVPLRRNLPGVF
jgi:hypothetical protein